MTEVPLPIRWRHAINASETGLSDTEHHVALTLSVFMNGEGRAKVSHAELGRNCRRRPETVSQALARLVELGYLTEQRPDVFYRGVVVTYRAAVPEKGSSSGGLNDREAPPEKGASSGGLNHRKPPSSGKKPPSSGTEAPLVRGGKSIKSIKSSSSDEEISESDLRRIAYEEAKREAHTNPDALAARKLREDRDRLTEKALEERRRHRTEQLAANCPRCDAAGLAHFTDDGIPCARDDPASTYSEVCDHQLEVAS